MQKFEQLPQKYYLDIHADIKSGDILLCAGTSIFSTLIQKATNSRWSHVAFILRLDTIDRIMVLESVESIGVRTVPLSHYVYNYNATGRGYPGQLLIARHQTLNETHIAKLSNLAIDYLGYPYDKEEIIHIAARLGLHNLGFKDLEPDPLQQKAFICSEYAQLCFQSIGIDISNNKVGFIAPNDFAQHPQIIPRYYIHTEKKHDTQYKENVQLRSS